MLGHRRGNAGDQVLCGFDFLAVKSDEYIARLQAGECGRALPVSNFRDDRSFDIGHAVHFGKLGLYRIKISS